MKILHTSDWHLGKRLEGFSRIEEQQAVLEEICSIADREEVHAVVIAGDLFDTFNPPADAVELFYRTLKKLAADGNRAVIAIAGNHDSPDRIEAPDPLARECGIILSGYPVSAIPPFRLDTGMELRRSVKGFIELAIPGTQTPLRILTTPYAHELRLRTFLGNDTSGDELRKLLSDHWKQLASEFCNEQGVNMMLAHLLFAADEESLPEEPDDERSINFIGGAPAITTNLLPEQLQYVACGHLHRYQLISREPCPVVYTGSPLAYSFSEADQDKFVVILEAEPRVPVKYRPVRLSSGKRLIRKRFENTDDAVAWLNANPDIYVELTIVSDIYLAARDRKRMLDAHDGIIALIPESRQSLIQGNQADAPIDPGQSMEELFRSYFISRKGQQPSENIMDLFREILATEDPS